MSRQVASKLYEFRLKQVEKTNEVPECSKIHQHMPDDCKPIMNKKKIEAVFQRIYHNPQVVAKGRSNIGIVKAGTVPFVGNFQAKKEEGQLHMQKQVAELQHLLETKCANPWDYCGNWDKPKPHPSKGVLKPADIERPSSKSRGSIFRPHGDTPRRKSDIFNQAESDKPSDSKLGSGKDLNSGMPHKNKPKRPSMIGRYTARAGTLDTVYKSDGNGGSERRNTTIKGHLDQ